MGGSNVTWDILVAALYCRAGLLNRLLSELGRQMVPGMGVHVFLDNREYDISYKRKLLVESSEADYVCFIDDDDWIRHDYVAWIMPALRESPDYVGFRVDYTEDNKRQRPAYHSLKHGHWFDTKHGLYRDLSHLNPIRRELALRGDWTGTYHNGSGEDIGWAESLRKLDIVKSEIFLDQELYWYRHDRSNNFDWCVQYGRMDFPPPRPEHEWVTWIEPSPSSSPPEEDQTTSPA